MSPQERTLNLLPPDKTGNYGRLYPEAEVSYRVCCVILFLCINMNSVGRVIARLTDNGNSCASAMSSGPAYINNFYMIYKYLYIFIQSYTVFSQVHCSKSVVRPVPVTTWFRLCFQLLGNSIAVLLLSVTANFQLSVQSAIKLSWRYSRMIAQSALRSDV